jgi:hypothetical protein
MGYHDRKGGFMQRIRIDASKDFTGQTIPQKKQGHDAKAFVLSDTFTDGRRQQRIPSGMLDRIPPSRYVDVMKQKRPSWFI